MMMELFSGNRLRRRPGSRVVYPSVARTTQGARTAPCAVCTNPGDTASAGVCS